MTTCYLSLISWQSNYNCYSRFLAGSNCHTPWHLVCSYWPGENSSPSIFFSKEHLKQFAASFTILLQGYFKSSTLCHNLVQGYSTLALQTFWVRSFFFVGHCPTHYTMFKSTFGFFLLDARNSSIPSCNKQKCLFPWLRTSDLVHGIFITFLFTRHQTGPLCWWYANWTWSTGSNNYSRYLDRQKHARGWEIHPTKTQELVSLVKLLRVYLAL